MNKVNYRIFCLVLVVLFSGCSTASSARLTSNKGLDNYIYDKSFVEEQMIVFVGESKNFLKEKYGSPHNIHRPGFLMGVEYKEEWSYKLKLKKGFLSSDSYIVSFYFNEDIIETFYVL